MTRAQAEALLRYIDYVSGRPPDYALSARAAFLATVDERPAGHAVHLLQHGRAACGTDLRRWCEDPADVTCPACKAKADPPPTGRGVTMEDGEVLGLVDGKVAAIKPKAP
jgi:hypothetical protein